VNTNNKNKFIFAAWT